MAASACETGCRYQDARAYFSGHLVIIAVIHGSCPALRHWHFRLDIKTGEHGMPPLFHSSHLVLMDDTSPAGYCTTVTSTAPLNGVPFFSLPLTMAVVSPGLRSNFDLSNTSSRLPRTRTS